MENNEMAPQFIKEEALIKVEVNAALMKVMRDILTELIDKLGQDKFILFTKQIMDEARGPENQLEYNIYYLSIFLGICERAALEQGALREMTEDEKKEWENSKASIQELKNESNES